MHRRNYAPYFLAAVTSVAVAATFGVPAATAAGSTGGRIHLVGNAAGSTVVLAQDRGSSSPTAPSGVDTLSGGQQSSNSTGNGSAEGLLAAGAVSTSVTTASVTGGLEVTSSVHSSGINLLDGAVTAASATTTARTSYADGKASTSFATSFDGLQVRGATVSRNPAKNTSVTLPDNAGTVLLNAQDVTTADSMSRASATAIVLTLKSAADGAPVGSVARVNAVVASAGPAGLGYAPLRGSAASDSMTTNSKASGSSGPITAIAMPHAGTGGKTVSRSTGSGTLPKAGTLGGTTLTANGQIADNHSRGTLTSDVTGVKLLQGMITAKSIGGTAQMTRFSDGTSHAYTASTFDDLVIDGKTIKSSVKPNTVVQLGTVGHVVINGRQLSKSAARVQPVVITLTKASSGLPAGTRIELGAASATFAP